ncbi:uncharacterized protein [Rutidosis leptorrhynchoides]|uniref:uncharacterized protein n=1 Tax=Rutidosis leptorrhynchoides TaxID=125765 RepID=UPI003A9A473A
MTTRFWHDVWIGNEPLASRFNRLYLDARPNCMVADRIIDSSFSWEWLRNPPVSCRLQHLTLELALVTLRDEDDIWRWNIEPEGVFTVRGTKTFLDDYYLPSTHTKTRWSNHVPGKANVFVWRLLLDRLPNRLNLSFHGLPIDTIFCPSCSIGGESRDHVFLFCNVAREIWHGISIWSDIRWQPFDSVNDIFVWLDSKPGSITKKSRMFCIVVSTLWWIWRLLSDTLFGSNTIKRCSILDYIRFSSYSWLKARSKFAPSWNTWITHPL